MRPNERMNQRPIGNITNTTLKYPNDVLLVDQKKKKENDLCLSWNETVPTPTWRGKWEGDEGEFPGMLFHFRRRD